MDSSRHLYLPAPFMHLHNTSKEMVVRRGSFYSNSASNNCSSPASHSIDAQPFEVESSWESVAASDMNRRQSFDSVNTDERCVSRTSFELEGYANRDYVAVPSMNDNVYPGYQQSYDAYAVPGHRGFSGQAIAYDFSSNNGFHGRSDNEISRETPPLDQGSPSQTSTMGCSPLSADFVVPSQTVLEAFDMHSPMRHPQSFHSEVSYRSPGSEYASASEYFGGSPYRAHGFRMSSDEMKTLHHSPSRPSPLQYPVALPLGSSPAFQQLVPSQGFPKSQRVKVGTSSLPIRRRIKREVNDPALPCNISVQKRSRKPCTWEGCTKKFERQEHLKRHMKTHDQKELYLCPFCKKPFSRNDNLKTHIGIHAAPNRKSMRTTYYPDAERMFQEMSSKPRRGISAPRSRPSELRLGA